MLQILKEIVIHWVIFVPCISIIILLIISISILNIFLWIPMLIYFIWILVKEPTIKEIDTWGELYDSYFQDVTLKSDVYKKSFSVIFEDKNSMDISEKTPKKGRLLLWHPHGIQAISLLIHHFWKSSPLYSTLSSCKIAVHSMLFQIPILRELLLLFGFIPATKSNISHYLKTGTSVCIIPGGVKEMSYSTNDRQNADTIYLSNRKGFIKFGHKYELVPIYVHGEQQFMTVPNKYSTYNIINIINKILSAIGGYTTNIIFFELFRPSIIIEWLKVQLGKSLKSTNTIVGKPIKTYDMGEYINNLQRIYKIYVNTKHELIVE